MIDQVGVFMTDKNSIEMSIAFNSRQARARTEFAKSKPLPIKCLDWMLRISFFVIIGYFSNDLPAAFGQTSSDKPVAVFGSEAIYEKDFVPQLQGQIYKVRQQEYELKLNALEAAINRKLVKAEAEKRGMSEEALLKKEVDSQVKEPTNEEVEQAFVQQMFQMNRPSSPSKDAVRKELKEAQLQAVRQEYFQSLREKAGVKIYLSPPRIDVGYETAPVSGDAAAKITMVEFSDYHCPFCLRAFTTVKTLLRKYKGQVKLAYRDLPLQESAKGVATSAEAARCAGEQGKFWEYHDLLFENQDLFGPVAFTDFADSLKLNSEVFKACLDSGKFKAPVKVDYDAAIKLGITGTPAFYINGIPISGARPLSEFEEVIDAELIRLEQ